MALEFVRNYCAPPWPDKKSLEKAKASVAKLLGWDSLYGINPLGIIEFIIPVYQDRLFNYVYIPVEKWKFGEKTCLFEFKNHNIAIREDIIIGANKGENNDVFIILTIIKKYLTYIKKGGKMKNRKKCS